MVEVTPGVRQPKSCLCVHLCLLRTSFYCLWK
nr:MAG TPA: hypothetical protein [Caudoviricetes sp.]